MTQYCFRLDDICDTLDWHKFNRLTNIFNEYNIKPLLGVIPKNEDDSLMIDRPNPDYLDLITSLVDIGWEVSMHGFEHLYCNREAGILKYPNKSEFSGLPFEEQKNKIRNGKRILADIGLVTNVFMAPSHSFDHITIEALKSEGFEYITDGFGILPYKINGIVLVPQQVANVKEFMAGNITFCLHPNNLTETDFRNIERFVKKNHKNCVSFSKILKYTLIGAILNVVPHYLHKIVRLGINSK